MSIFQKSSFWVLVTAVALFWMADFALGTAANRDVVDWVSMAFAFIMGCRLLPDAIDRFNRGGGQKNWQLLIGNFLLAWGWFAYVAWTFVARGFRIDWELHQSLASKATYEWMINSPLNGFFKFWLLSGFVMTFFGTNETPTTLPATKLYYIGVGLAVGILLGIIGTKLLPA